MIAKSVYFETPDVYQYFDLSLEAIRLCNLYKCTDCGVVCKRLGSRQKRCVWCQTIYAKRQKKIKQRERRARYANL